MLNPRFIKDNEKEVRNSIKKRDLDEKILDSFLVSNKEYLKVKEKVDFLRHERNTLSKQINKAKKQGKDIKELIHKAKKIPKDLEFLETELRTLNEKQKDLLKKIPNILGKDIPIGKDESKNKVIKKHGKPKKFSFKVKNHIELGEKLDILDFDSSSKTSGTGFYYLKGDLALLNQALIAFAINHMSKKKYNYIETPLVINKKIAAAAGDLDAFKLALYKIQDEDEYLIPTSEHTMLGMFSGKTISEEKLPLKLFSYSMCFRKEIGSHGINEKGLWRTHQFNKIEQFIFCKSRDSKKYYLELRKNSEEIIKALKLPYRILESCSGDLSTWKMKGEDIEIYRPTTKKYEEVSSLSNCGIYQSNDLGIKGINKKGERYLLYTLNNTVIATSRILVCILENYQQKDGSIKVPVCLQKYMNGLKVIGKPKKKKTVKKTKKKVKKTKKPKKKKKK